MKYQAVQKGHDFYLIRDEQVIAEWSGPYIIGAKQPFAEIVQILNEHEAK